MMVYRSRGTAAQTASITAYRRRHPERARARSAVTAAIQVGKMPPAKTLPCFDCKDVARDYDHYLGYDEAHTFDVQPVCRPCHVKRGVARGSFGWKFPLKHSLHGYMNGCRCKRCRDAFLFGPPYIRRGTPDGR